MTRPTIRDIENLHKKYAPTDKAYVEIWQHCQIVKRIATWCITNSTITNVDRELVEIGSLLHDVGVYMLYNKDGTINDKNYISHGVLGYNLLKEECFDEILCRFASHHTGVGITANEVKNNNLPLPVADYLADTDEERLVMYADKYHSKDPSQFNSVEWYKSNLSKKFGQSKVIIFEEMVADFGIPPIQKMAEIYKQRIR